MVLKSPQESAGRAIEWILSPSEQETWRLDDIRESRKDHVVKRSLGDPKRESFDLLTVGSYYMNLYIYIYAIITLYYSMGLPYMPINWGG